VLNHSGYSFLCFAGRWAESVAWEVLPALEGKSSYLHHKAKKATKSAIIDRLVIIEILPVFSTLLLLLFSRSTLGNEFLIGKWRGFGLRVGGLGMASLDGFGGRGGAGR
jgi:hypothetical protein